MNIRPKCEKGSDKPAARYEPFGGIISIDDPPALAFVDKEYMKEVGYSHSELWDGTQQHLSAPTEVHFNLTNTCPLKCRHCTSDSVNQPSDDMSAEDIKKAIDILAEMKVFHVAFGGGELFARPDAIEIAEYAASKGIVPNATTNGYYMTPELAEKCRVFGQINISMDGIGENYSIVRGTNIFDMADRACRLLVEAGINTGINCMVTRPNFDMLEEVVAYAHDLGLIEVLFLRLKPSGRAKEIYDQYKLTREQGRRFYKKLMNLAKKYQPNILVDCSFIPHICYQKPSKKAMRLLGVEGCEGGNVLLGLRHDGWVNACSHYSEYYQDIMQLKDLWNNHDHFRKFRERKVNNPVCTNCKYFSLCRGGCPLFSEFLTGDFNAPDPECPVFYSR